MTARRRPGDKSDPVDTPGMLRLALRRFGRHRLAVASAAMLAALVLLAPTAAATGGQEKVEICHVPPGNPDNPQTLRVGAKAVEAHLKNHPGDSVGPCQDPCVCDDGDLCTHDACGDCNGTHCYIVGGYL